MAIRGRLPARLIWQGSIDALIRAIAETNTVPALTDPSIAAGSDVIHYAPTAKILIASIPPANALTLDNRTARAPSPRIYDINHSSSG